LAKGIRHENKNYVETIKWFLIWWGAKLEILNLKVINLIRLFKGSWSPSESTHTERKFLFLFLSLFPHQERKPIRKYRFSKEGRSEDQQCSNSNIIMSNSSTVATEIATRRQAKKIKFVKIEKRVWSRHHIYYRKLWKTIQKEQGLRKTPQHPS